MPTLVESRVPGGKVGSIFVPYFQILTVMSTIREKAAKFFYESDITLNEDASVKELISLMEKFGEQIAREYYQTGISDAVLNRINNDFLKPSGTKFR